MPRGLIDLKFTGDANLYINGNPQITFFKTAYKQYSNFSKEYVELTFESNKELNPDKITSDTCKIERIGDLLHDIYLVFDLPAVYSIDEIPFQWVESIGNKLIDNVEVLLNGQSISKLRGEFMKIYNHISLGGTKKSIYDKLINNEINSTTIDISNSDTNGSFPDIPARRLYIPLDFWFCKNVGMSLPLISLQYTFITIKIEFSKINDLFKIGDPLISPYQMFEGTTPLSAKNQQYKEIIEQTQRTESSFYDKNTLFEYFVGDFKTNYFLLANYIFIDETERRFFAQTSHDYLIKQCNYRYKDGLRRGTNVIDLDFSNLITEFIWYLRPNNLIKNNNWFNFTCINNKNIIKYNNDIKDYIHDLNTIDSTTSSSQTIINLKEVDKIINDKLKEQYNTLYDSAEFSNNVSLEKWDYYSIMKSAKLIYNGNDRFRLRENKFFELLQIYKYHNGNTMKGLYNYSFALEPEKDQPTGTLNISKINRPQLYLRIFESEILENKLDNFEIHLYAINYNIFRIIGGIGQMVFSN